MAEALWMLAYVVTGAGVALAGYWVGLLRGRAESLRAARNADAEFRATIAAHRLSFPPPPAPGFAARRKQGARDA